ncbi:unnamed protein product [Sphagnum tenellum]
MASSFPSTANRGERRASVSPGLGDPSRSYRSPVAAYRDACLRLSSRAEEPRARGFACPAPHLLLAIASLPNPAIGHICLGLLPRKSLGYQSLHVWEARSAQIRGKTSCNLVKNIYSFRSFPTAAVETDDDDDEFQFGPGVSSTFGCLDRIL